VNMLDTENTYRYLRMPCALGLPRGGECGPPNVQKGLPNLLRAAKEVVYRAPKTLCS
jgi:hypothetical protein